MCDFKENAPYLSEWGDLRKIYVDKFDMVDHQAVFGRDTARYEHGLQDCVADCTFDGNTPSESAGIE